MYICNYIHIWRAARNVENPPANNYGMNEVTQDIKWLTWWPSWVRSHQTLSGRHDHEHEWIRCEALWCDAWGVCLPASASYQRVAYLLPSWTPNSFPAHQRFWIIRCADNSPLHADDDDDDDVSFYNSTASTWTLATPRTTWEFMSLIMQESIHKIPASQKDLIQFWHQQQHDCCTWARLFLVIDQLANAGHCQSLL